MNQHCTNCPDMTPYGNARGIMTWEYEFLDTSRTAAQSEIGFGVGVWTEVVSV